MWTSVEIILLSRSFSQKVNLIKPGLFCVLFCFFVWTSLTFRHEKERIPRCNEWNLPVNSSVKQCKFMQQQAPWTEGLGWCPVNIYSLQHVTAEAHRGDWPQGKSMREPQSMIITPPINCLGREGFVSPEEQCSEPAYWPSGFVLFPCLLSVPGDTEWISPGLGCACLFWRCWHDSLRWIITGLEKQIRPRSHGNLLHFALMDCVACDLFISICALCSTCVIRVQR